MQAFQQYGPEFSKVLTQQYIDAQKRAPEAYPELYQVLEPLTKAVSGRLNDINSNGGVPQGVLTPYTNAIRGAQAARGFFESPISAAEEANYLLPYAEQYRKDVIGEGNSLVGTLNTLRSLPESSYGVDLDSLGLTPPSINSGMQLNAQTLQPFEQEAKLQNYQNTVAYNQSQAKKKNTGLGAMIGAGTGAIIGLSGGPIGAVQGAQIGGNLATFF